MGGRRRLGNFVADDEHQQFFAQHGPRKGRKRNDLALLATTNDVDGSDGAAAVTRGRRRNNNSSNSNDDITDNNEIGSGGTGTGAANDGANPSAEMMIMAAAGAALSIGVVLVLGMDGPGIPGRRRGGLEFGAQDALEDVAGNIADAVLPNSSADVVAVAIGEGFAGIIGALASNAIASNLAFGSNGESGASRQQSRPVGGGAVAAAAAFGRGRRSTVLADSDFFVTRAAALPLLEATGLPPFLASIASVLVATVPYELVKIGARRRVGILEENKELTRLLLNEQQQLKQSPSKNGLGWGQLRMGPQQEQQQQTLEVQSVDPGSLIPIRAEEEKTVDVVEIFSDVMKWLEYDVLLSSLGGKLFSHGLPFVPFVESAVFGAVAAVSSMGYADLLYGWFGLGGSAKREAVRTRTLPEWLAAYVSEATSSAVLFGVCAAAKQPVKTFTSALLSGGLGSCFGSDRYDMCVDTFVMGNPLEASPAGELRAALISIASLWNQFGLPTWDNPPEPEIRAFVTAFASFCNQFGLFS